MIHVARTMSRCTRRDSDGPHLTRCPPSGASTVSVRRRCVPILFDRPASTLRFDGRSADDRTRRRRDFFRAIVSRHRQPRPSRHGAARAARRGGSDRRGPLCAGRPNGRIPSECVVRPSADGPDAAGARSRRAAPPSRPVRLEVAAGSAAPVAPSGIERNVLRLRARRPPRRWPADPPSSREIGPVAPPGGRWRP